jgi:hypothetical protein
LAIAGNKSDQLDGKFNNAHVLEYCAAKKIDHFYASAKTGDGV